MSKRPGVLYCDMFSILLKYFLFFNFRDKPTFLVIPMMFVPKADEIVVLIGEITGFCLVIMFL
jgi:hypothetical protein